MRIYGYHHRQGREFDTKDVVTDPDNSSNTKRSVLED